MNINFDSYTPEFKKAFKDRLPVWWSELRVIFPQLPREITIWFNNQLLVPGMHTGGSALTKDSIVIAAKVNVDFKDLEAEMRNTIYHEAYHLVQGFIGQEADANMTLLENGIYEGAATVFEKQYSKSNPPYGEWDDELIEKWLPDIMSLQGTWTERHDDLKFWDPISRERNILYRVCTGLVEQALEKSNKRITDFATMPASEIIALSHIDT